MHCLVPQISWQALHTQKLGIIALWGTSCHGDFVYHTKYLCVGELPSHLKRISGSTMRTVGLTTVAQTSGLGLVSELFYLWREQGLWDLESWYLNYCVHLKLGEAFDRLLVSQCFPASPQVLFTLLEKEIRLLWCDLFFLWCSFLPAFLVLRSAMWVSRNTCFLYR